MSKETVMRERKQKDVQFKSGEQSPLSDAQKAQFNGLSYFEYDPAMDMTVTVDPLPERGQEPMTMNDGSQGPPMQAIGRFSFTVNGENAALTIFQVGDQFGMHFKDATNGKESYGAGRFAFAKRIDETTFQVDFNRAGNPMCAYADGWSCPVAPPENRLDVPIRAGEKAPQGDWVPH